MQTVTPSADVMIPRLTGQDESLHPCASLELRQLPSATTGNEQHHNSNCREVAAAIAALSRRQRVSLLLRVRHNLSYAEIAAAIRCSEDNARASVYEGLRALRDHLGDWL